jgi:thiol-disulfide isomerase/thioredoxin
MAGAPVYAADGGLDGNYKLNYFVGANEIPLALIKLETKDGKLEGSVLAAGQIGAQKVSKVSVDGKTIHFDVEGGAAGNFEGIVAGDTVPGSFLIGTNLLTAVLVKTTDEKIENRPSASKMPEVAQAAQLELKVNRLQVRLRQEKDAEKKAELVKELAEAKEEAGKEVPKLHREIMEKYADSPVIITVGKGLLVNEKAKPSPEEARKWIAAMSKVAAKHGPRFADDCALQIAETVAPLARLKELALEMTKKAESALNDKSTTEDRVRVMKALLPALKNNAKTDEAKSVEAQLAKLETVLDKEYMVKVPPFKPEMYAGRKEKSDRKVVMELFTGAQCPPCVAADVAFDALEKSYKPSELILLQYHLHIPGPDPLTNTDTLARASFYKVNSTPTTIFNGKSAAAGGGGMANSKGKFDQYRKVINPILEENSDAKLLVTASQVGNKIDIKAEVSGLKDPGEKKRLRLVLVEEAIRYVGGNKLRFHHHVVRALPGGAAGFALKEANSQHSATVNLDELRAQIIKYLDTYAEETRAFPYPDRPLDFKNLKVIGLVQDDESKEILQVMQVDLGGETTTRLNEHK